MNTSRKYQFPDQKHSRRGPKENLDRFIPNRSAMDMDYAHYMVMEGSKANKQNLDSAANSPSRVAFRKNLAEAMGLNKTRILAFKNKSLSPVDLLRPKSFYPLAPHSKLSKPQRHVSERCVRTLDAPDIVDDYYLNLLDWGSGNVLAIALGSTVYLWDAATGKTSELGTPDEENGSITSVSWAPNCSHLALGLDNSEIELWDTTKNQRFRTLSGGHRSRVGSLAWNDHTLTTGGMDSLIINNDVRIRDPIVDTYKGHNQEICGLKWSASGRHLASGGNDNLVHVWDKSMAASNSSRRWLHKIEEHTAAIKALAWCPFKDNLLASGGGEEDHSIKMWNTNSGACLKSVVTGSAVCGLLWNPKEKELLSSHGFTQNQLTLWKYPSMVKMAELKSHTSRVLYMARSPDGCTVASAAGDETLRFWNVFGTPAVGKPEAKVRGHEPFSNLSFIR